MNNYDGYYDSCGGYGQGCSVGGGCGSDYKVSSPDYSPVTVNNSTCPTVEGSTSTGGSSYGNNSNICVTMGGCGCNDKADCCREGAKKLLCFLSEKALGTPSPTATAYVYGDILDTSLFDGSNSLISLANATAISNMCVSDQVVSTNAGEVVSLCSISVITFTNSLADFKQGIKEIFKYVRKCSCSCECGNAIAEALCVYGLGNNYNIVVQDAIIGTGLATLSNLKLVAVDNNIAIFEDATGYYGIPTCRIAKFTRA